MKKETKEEKKCIKTKTKLLEKYFPNELCFSFFGVFFILIIFTPKNYDVSNCDFQETMQAVTKLLC